MDGFGNFLGNIVAGLVSVLPLFIVPVLLKKSLDSLPGLGNQLSKLRSKTPSVGGKLKSAAKKGDLYNTGKNLKGSMESSRLSRQNRRLARNLSGEGRFGRAGAFISRGGPAITATQKDAQKNLQSAARATVLKEQTENLENELKEKRAQAVREGRAFNEAEELEKIATAPKTSPEEKRAALHMMAQRGNVSEIRRVKGHFKATGDSSALVELDEAVSTNASSLMAKAPDLIKGASAFKDVSGSEIVQFHSSTAKAHVDQVLEFQTKATAARKAHADAVANGSDPQEIKMLESVANAAESEYTTYLQTAERAFADIANNPTLQAQFKGEARSEYARLGLVIQPPASPPSSPPAQPPASQP